MENPESCDRDMEVEDFGVDVSLEWHHVVWLTCFAFTKF